MLTYSDSIPFAEAYELARRKGLLRNLLSSAELSQLNKQVRQRAIFSARMDKAEVLDVLQKMVMQIISNRPVEGEDRYRSIPEAKMQLKDAMLRAGVPIAPQGTPSIQDFYSNTRRQLMVETTVLDTLGFGRHVATQNDEMLWANPGLELVRFVIPKGGVEAERPWLQRWNAAFESLSPEERYGCTDLQTSGVFRMVAQKNHPIWQALGDGVGGYTDGLGNHWAPFAFNSGMNTIEATREDCEALGIIGTKEKVTPDRSFDMNESLEASVAAFDEGLRDELEGGGLEILDGVLRAVANSRRARATGILCELGEALAANTAFDGRGRVGCLLNALKEGVAP